MSSVPKCRAAVFLGLLLLLPLMTRPAFATPVPTVTANSGINQVIAMPGELLDVIISINAGSDAGMNADWWLYADTTYGLFHYDLSGDWFFGMTPSYQGPLFSFDNFKVLSVAGLPVGTYNINFGVDFTMNGRFDGVKYFDTVKVTIPQIQCPTNTRTSLDALSADQKAFIAARGNPDFFTISFISERIDRANNTIVPLSSIRRVDTWAFNSSGAFNTGKLTSVYFDNGYFVSETQIGAAISLQNNRLSPANFTPCMTREDIVALLGEPDCTQSEMFGDSTLSYMRYNPTATRPASTIVLDNGVLVTVMSGYSIAPASSGNNLCAQF